MGITGKIKQISSLTLDLLKAEPFLVEAFFSAECLPESAFWQRVTNWPAELSQKIRQYARVSFCHLPNGRTKHRFIQESQQSNPVIWID